jgi:hypothetical protein
MDVSSAEVNLKPGASAALYLQLRLNRYKLYAVSSFRSENFMVILPRLRCPACGKGMGPVKAREVPPAIKFEDCLRQCPRCKIGATNAKNPAKVKYIYAEVPPAATTVAKTPPAETSPAEAPKAEAPQVEAPQVETPQAKTPKAKTPKAKAPKTKAPKAKAPKAKAPKAEIPPDATPPAQP